MVREVILPKLGQTMEEGAIIEWFKGEGDLVQRGEVLFTTESDKATLEVESPGKGFLRKILVPAGETVQVLAVVGILTRQADEDISGYESGDQISGIRDRGSGVGDQVLEAVAVAPPEPETLEPETLKPAGGRVFASPRARKLAREEDVDLALVAGTGPNGRIVERDVVAHLETIPKATPVARRLAEQKGFDLRTVVGTGPGGRITKEDVEQALTVIPPAPAAVPAPLVAPAADRALAEVPMSGVRAVIARNMHESHQVTAPVTLTTEADATDLVVLRERLKASLADELGIEITLADEKAMSQASSPFRTVDTLVDYIVMRLEEGGDA